MGLQRKTVLGFKPRRDSHRDRGSRGFGGEERGPRGFGRVGTCGSNTADDAGSLNHGLLLLFLRCGTPDWAEGEGRTVCICGYSKGL